MRRSGCPVKCRILSVPRFLKLTLGAHILSRRGRRVRRPATNQGACPTLQEPQSDHYHPFHHPPPCQGASAADLLNEVQAAQRTCEAHGARLWVNDHWETALACGAYGVHIGQEDLAAMDRAEVRLAPLHPYCDLLRHDACLTFSSSPLPSSSPTASFPLCAT